MSPQKLILREYFELCEGGICEDLLTEEEKRYVSGGGLILSGVMQRADAKNGNGRIYPFNILSREIENYKQIIKEKRALGELDHPGDAIINLKNASHIVTDIWWDGKDVVGKVKVLTTPSGQILRSLIESGVKLGISSRGLGSVRQSSDNTLVVENDLKLIAFDFVSEPSTAGAFMNISESMAHDIDSQATRTEKLARLMNEVLF
jgi:hypothetical protein